jgi:hypothetical protein
MHSRASIARFDNDNKSSRYNCLCNYQQATRSAEMRCGVSKSG